MKQRLEELEESLGKCKIDVFASIANINKTLTEQDEVRHQMNEKLNKIANKLLTHTDEEMEKYNEILFSVEELTKTMRTLIHDTKENTRYVTSKQHNEELEKRVAEKMNEINAPREEIMNKVKMTAVGVITTVATGGLLSALWFGFELYVMIHGES